MITAKKIMAPGQEITVTAEQLHRLRDKESDREFIKQRKALRQIAKDARKNYSDGKKSYR